MSGCGVSRCSRVLHDFGQLTADAAALLCDLLSCFLRELHYESDKFKRFEQSIVVLPVNDDVIVAGKQLLTDMRHGFFRELLFSLAHEVELKKVVSQHDKDNLVDNQGKSARGKMSQVAEAFELTASLFCGGSKMVFLSDLTRIHCPSLVSISSHVSSWPSA